MQKYSGKVHAEIVRRIEAHQGETFKLKGGKTFTYTLGGRTLTLDTGKPYPIGLADVKKAVERMPVQGPGLLNDLRAPVVAAQT